MPPEIKQQLDNMQNQITALSQKLNESQTNVISLPVPDETRKNIGIGFISRETDVTVSGSILCNSNEGQIKLLYTA